MTTPTRTVDASDNPVQVAVYRRVYVLLWLATLLAVGVMVSALIAMSMFDDKVRDWMESAYADRAFAIGKEYEYRQEYEQAIELYREALEGTFQNAESKRLCGISLGDLLMRLKRYEEAIVAYANLPDEAFIGAGNLTGYVTALYRAGRLDEASTLGRRWLEKANAQEDRLQQRWANSMLGNIEMERANSDEAIAYFRALASLDPKNSARVNIARILRDQGKIDEALDELEMILAEIDEGSLFASATKLRNQILEQRDGV